jgi:hypothetical protein
VASVKITLLDRATCTLCCVATEQWKAMAVCTALIYGPRPVVGQTTDSSDEQTHDGQPVSAKSQSSDQPSEDYSYPVTIHIDEVGADLTGDGNGHDVLPGTNVGAFGRSVTAGSLNQVISKFNSSSAGTDARGSSLGLRRLVHASAIANSGRGSPDCPNCPSRQRRSR